MDLSDIRRRIDRLSDQIVGRLKDRSYFPLNPPVYIVGGIEIAGARDQTFLTHSLAGLERYHAALGRYSYPDQHPLLDDVLPDAPVRREVATLAIPQSHLRLWDALLPYYQTLLPQICPPGDDVQSYGETVYVDADLLVRLHERIIIGRYVAHSKAERQPEILALLHRPADLRDALIDVAREAAVLAKAADLARKYELSPAAVQGLFRWVMDQTLTLEVRYLQQVNGVAEE